MIVYGDRARRVSTSAVLDAIARERDPVARLIALGELTQGVADAERDAAGEDVGGPGERACMAALMAVADASTRDDVRTGDMLAALAGLAAIPSIVTLKDPEGYAFYALHPAAHAAAARALVLPGPIRVIGIRSIGTGLAALVAVTLGASAPATLRPVGHPFAREVHLSAGLAARLLGPPGTRYVIVDEGPGLSGSSFGAVADWLNAHGVADDCIVFLPGHAGELGPRASPAHRARWARARRPVAEFETVMRAPLTAAVAALIGPLDSPLQDIGAGRWRALRWPEPADWPPAAPQWERRKYLARANGATWLVKFAGLGAIGARKLARARALHAAGFTPEPAGLVHGFLVERWHAGAATPPRAAILACLPAYLGCRARAFPAPHDSGAALDALLAMARHNLADAGDPASDALAAEGPPRLAAKVRRVATDNRLDPHEWLARPDGRVLKADALDHCEAHDLIGCQDIAWDVANAALAFALDPAETAALTRAVPADPELVAFYTPCARAFRIGWHTMAAQACDVADAARHHSAVNDLLSRKRES